MLPEVNPIYWNNTKIITKDEDQEKNVVNSLNTSDIKDGIMVLYHVYAREELNDSFFNDFYQAYNEYRKEDNNMIMLEIDNSEGDDIFTGIMFSKGDFQRGENYG